MSDSIYPFEQQGENVYTFISEGPKGSVRKVVTFEEVFPGAYNVLLQDEMTASCLMTWPLPATMMR